MKVSSGCLDRPRLARGLEDSRQEHGLDGGFALEVGDVGVIVLLRPLYRFLHGPPPEGQASDNATVLGHDRSPFLQVARQRVRISPD